MKFMYHYNLEGGVTENLQGKKLKMLPITKTVSKSQ